MSPRINVSLSLPQLTLQSSYVNNISYLGWFSAKKYHSVYGKLLYIWLLYDYFLQNRLVITWKPS